MKIVAFGLLASLLCAAKTQTTAVPAAKGPVFRVPHLKHAIKKNRTR